MHRKLVVNIGIKHDFPFINIRTDPREVLKSLLLHKLAGFNS